MGSKGIMAIDQGTTSSRAVVFGPDGAALGSAHEAFAQHFPKPGWVEHDPEDIWTTQLRCCRLALERSGLDAADLAAVGIANQRETVLLWDAESGAAPGKRHRLAVPAHGGALRGARSWPAGAPAWRH